MKNVIIKYFLPFFTSFILLGQVDSLETNYTSPFSEDLLNRSEPPEKIHPFSIRISSGVPNPLTSQMYRKSMMGIYEVNLCVTRRITNYYYFGFGTNYTLLSISNRSRFEAKTKMQNFSGYLRIGYDHYLSQKIFHSFFLNLGYNKGFYSDVLNLKKKPRNLNFEMFYLQPSYSINFLSEERVSLGFYFAWKYFFWQFNPDQLNLADAGIEISQFKNNSNVSNWLLGLEMFIGIGKLNN